MNPDFFDEPDYGGWKRKAYRIQRRGRCRRDANISSPRACLELDLEVSLVCGTREHDLNRKKRNNFGPVRNNKFESCTLCDVTLSLNFYLPQFYCKTADDG